MLHPLQQRVGFVRRWWNRRALVEFACWLIAACLGLVIAVGMVDYLVRAADRGLRILLSMTLAGALVAVAWRLSRWWRRQRWSDMRAAYAVQQAYPELGDRLASALEFLRQEEDDVTAGSAPLRRAVVAETTATLETLPAEQVAQRPGIRRAACVAVAAMVVAGLLAIFAPMATRTAVTRLVAPWNNVEWPRIHNLEFVEPPTLVARGDAFEASLTDSTGALPAEVAIEYRYQADGRTRTEQTWMQRVGDTMVARRENVRRDFEFRATGGDHQTMPWTKVEVVDRPNANGLVLNVHPPTYTGLPITTARTGTRAVSGSTVEVAATASQPLSGASLVVGNEQAITIALDPSNPTSIFLPAGVWRPTTDQASEPLRASLALTAASGLKGEVPLPPFELVTDELPTVDWAFPSEDLSVVAGAQVPIEVIASDDLALSQVKLAASLIFQANPEIPVMEVDLYQGPPDAPARESLPVAGEVLDQQRLAHAVDFASLEVAAGGVLELVATATDYKRQVGETVKRRITIISAAELDSQLAGEQAEILRLLEQALADQRSARDQSAQVASLDAASRAILDGLLSARLTQQGVRRTLLAADSGVVNCARDVIDRLTMNRVQQPDLVAQLKHIITVVEQLGTQPLPAAEQQLTSLRKQVESLAGTPNDELREQLSNEFTALEAEQQAIIVALEDLVGRANDWSDAERFVRELARLEQEQRGLREQTLEAVRRNIEAATNRQIEPMGAAEIERMAAAQADLTRRFDKLAEAMRQMAQSDGVTSDFGARLQDAVSAAESMGLSSELAAAERQVAEQQLGRATQTQQSAADNLQELVDRLRDRAPTDPGELASRLRALQQRLAELKQQADDAKEQGDAERQAKQRSDLADELDQLSRELARLTAQAASASTQQASNSAAPKPGESPGDVEKKLEQAERDIGQAERELAQRIAELEGERQQRLLDRLAEVLDDLTTRQQNALEQTLRVDHARESSGELEGEALSEAERLSGVETKLAGELDEAMADVEKRAVFQLALGGAADDMQQAARALAQYETGRVTQNLELSALSRMRHVLDILRDPPPPPTEAQESSGGGGGGGDQPQQPPLIELAEVKMLRWLQVDLNGRTRLFEADLADEASVAAQKREAADRLAAEQHRLEELVRQMMERNNENMQRPIDL